MVFFDGFKVVDDLFFYLDFKEICVIIGFNGVGKIIVLDLICGKICVIVGLICFGGNEFIKMKEYQIVYVGVG